MNNEFAFPRIVPEGDTLQSGLTKREYYAAQALPMLISPDVLSIDPDSGTWEEETAKAAFSFADAMIKESKKQQNEK